MISKEKIVYFKDSAMLFLFMGMGLMFSGGSLSALSLRKASACAIASFLVQIAVRKRFFCIEHIQSFLLLGWYALFLLFKVYVLQDNSIESIELTLFISIYLAMCVILVEHFINYYLHLKRLHLAVDIVKLIFVMVPVVTIVHWFIYHVPTSFDEMVAVYNTDFHESAEWIKTFLGMQGIVAIVIFILLVFAGFSFFRQLVLRHIGVKNAKLRNKYLIIFCIAATGYYPFNMVQEYDWVNNYLLAKKYIEGMKDYRESVNDMSDNIHFFNKDMIVSCPHTVIMVIGESGARDYMKAYNEKYMYNNSPWQSRCRNDDDFVVFDNLYSCYGLTVQVLECALTEKSQYNHKSFVGSMNIVDIAKKKGYKTYWFSSSAGKTIASPYALVGQQSDECCFEGQRYDDEMLKWLKKINPMENNFIVFHGSGSHVAFKDRYPQERAYFKDNTIDAEYSNAILYVDEFLKKVYEYGRENLNLQLMVYYSDHGINVKMGHAPGSKGYDRLRIPAFVYMGKEYQAKNKEKYCRLRESGKIFFTNDMMYNLMSDLLNAESNFYDPEEDIISGKYRFKVDDLVSYYGEFRISEDPLLK